jgi:hypothetical protein
MLRGRNQQQNRMSLPSPFIPVSHVPSTETDEFTYQPTENLHEAFMLLDMAIAACVNERSFDEVLNVCRKCRTAFAEFTGEAITGGTVARAILLPRITGLLHASELAVEDAKPFILDPDKLALAEGYLRHIRRRLELAAAMKSMGLKGYLDEIRTKLAPVSAMTEDLAEV